MKGNIYPTKYGYNVRFGRKICRHFKELKKAERFLNGLRFKTDEGSFDIRDYRSGNPLGFATQAEKWLDMKRKKIKSVDNLNRCMAQAAKEWGQTNVKYIGYGQLEDFIFRRDDISEKTRAGIRSCLHDFFTWLSKREGIPKPEFPEVKFELGWRNIIDTQTQQNIISEVGSISFHINPKIWFGIKSLATYISIRPGELISIKESEINLVSGLFLIPHPKEKTPKIVYLLEQDIEFLKSIPRGLPGLYFFRHVSGIQGAKAGRKFSRKYLYTWWKRACKNLGIEGVDLYGGTRHSTTTALGKICTPEEIKDATGHTSQAFQRYFQDRQGRALKVTEKIKLLSNQPLINIQGGSKKDKVLKIQG